MSDLYAPGWLQAVYARAAAEQAYLKQALALQRNIDLTKTPGYKELDIQYLAEPDPGYERDPLVVRALKRRWPDLVPIFVRWIFEAEDGHVEIFKRHGLARILNDPHHELVPLPIAMGSGQTKPHIIERVFHTPDPEAKYKDLPGPYEPFSWNIYNFVADNYKERSPEELKKAFIEDKKEELVKAKRAAADEEGYRRKDVNKFIQKKLEQTSEVELKRMMLRRYFGGAEPEKKSSVNIRRSDE